MTDVCQRCGCRRVNLVRRMKNVDRWQCVKCKHLFYVRKAGKTEKMFYMFERREASLIYKKALESAGYTRTQDPQRADFLFLDFCHEQYSSVVKNFMKRGKPVFVYPHSANSWYFWDGIHEEFPVSCNFVFTDNIKNAMVAFGYRSRIEPCGFSLSDVKQSAPSDGKTLLYIPMHTLGKEGSDFLRPPASLDLNRKTLDRIVKMAPLFKRVTVRYGKSFDASGMYDPHLDNVFFEKAVLKASDCRTAIQRHDIIIAAGTSAYISVALGKPTIFFNQKNEAPTEIDMTVKSYEQYKHFLDYPIQLSDMTNEQVVRFATDFHSDKVEKWKNSNIGKSFDKDRLLSVVREYVG